MFYYYLELGRWYIVIKMENSILVWILKTINYQIN